MIVIIISCFLKEIQLIEEDLLMTFVQVVLVSLKERESFFDVTSQFMEDTYTYGYQELGRY